MSSPTAASRLCTAQSTSPVRIHSQAVPALLERFADLQSRCIDPDTFDAADFELWQALDDRARERRLGARLPGRRADRSGGAAVGLSPGSEPPAGQQQVEAVFETFAR